MGRTALFGADVVERARELVQGASDAREMRVGLSVLVSAVCGVRNGIVAQVLGVSVATVVRLQGEVRDQVAGSAAAKRTWGGRRRQAMSYEEEVAFLEPWGEQSKTGGVLVVPPIHAAFEETLGHPVAPSTVYRMLARHRWRKVEPDTCHPKRDAEAQEAFKKGASRRLWRRLSPGTQKACPCASSSKMKPVSDA